MMYQIFALLLFILLLSDWPAIFEIAGMEGSEKTVTAKKERPQKRKAPKKERPHLRTSPASRQKERPHLPQKKKGPKKRPLSSRTAT